MTPVHVAELLDEEEEEEEGSRLSRPRIRGACWMDASGRTCCISRVIKSPPIRLGTCNLECLFCSWPWVNIPVT